MHRVKLILIVSFGSFANQVWSHDFVHKHNCPKPIYTINYEDEDALSRLNQEIADFQICIRAFVDYQLKQSMAHSDVSRSAMSEIEEIADEIQKHAPKELIEKWQSEASTDEP